jgi:hypothetical protein
MEPLTLTPADLLGQDDPDVSSTHAPAPDDPPLLEINAPLPDWLLTADDDVREDYLARLSAYHVAATRLEAHLDEVLPSFVAYTCEQLAARIRADLDVLIDPDTVVIDMPRHVSRRYDIDPQFGMLKPGAPWFASAEREQLSLSELARQNIDPDDLEMTQRLKFARVEYPAPQPFSAGLTPEYLGRTLPQLNIAQGYRSLLNTVFRLPALATEQAQHDAQRLLAPYELNILLEGFVALQRRRLSAPGYRLLTLAAQTRSRAETDAAQIDMYWLVLNPGSSANGERSGLTLSGVCLIHERITGLTLIYLPDEPEGRVLLEASGLQGAKDSLIQRLLSRPACVAYLAERTLDGAQQARHVSYINESLTRGFDGFIRFVPALDLQMANQQLQTRAWQLFEQTRATSRSNHDLQRERNMRQNQRYRMYLKGLLTLLPGVGTAISVHEGWRDGHAAAQAFSEGNTDDGLLQLGSLSLSVLDVVLSVVPGAVSVGVLAKTARQVMRLKPAGSLARHRHVIQPFQGYDVDVQLSDAIRQSGRNAGTYLQDGQLWISRAGRAYPVYRRAGEQTLRLRKNPRHGYEPPVRLEDGQWVYHSDVGLRGGVKSAIAETLITEANPDPAFRRTQARQLLDQFRFPPDDQRRFELDVAVHYQAHRTTPGWAETYRKPSVQSADTAQAGPSGNKRKAPAPTDNAAKRSPNPGAVGVRADTPQYDPQGWRQWGYTLDGQTVPEPLRIQPPIYRLHRGQGSECVQIDSRYYDILPAGSSQHPSIVLLRNPASQGEGFGSFNESIRQGLGAQPVMAAFEQGVWKVHGPLFTKKIQHLVADARPGLTATTQRVLAEKLFDMADPSASGLTAIRLINLKATLNAWRKELRAPLPELQDPLLMLEGGRYAGEGIHCTIRTSYGPALQPFQRLDFNVTEPTLAGLLNSAKSEALGITVASKESLRVLMSQVLINNGYTVVAGDEVALRVRAALVFRRPGMAHTFVLKMRRFSGSRSSIRVGEVSRDATGTPLIPLSAAWLDDWAATQVRDEALDAVMQARTQGTLIRLIGGTNVTSGADTGTQVFVQRMADDL